MAAALFRQEKKPCTAMASFRRLEISCSCVPWDLGDEGSFNGPGLESRTPDRRIRETAGLWDIGLRTYPSSSRISDYWTSDSQYDIAFPSLADIKKEHEK
jgi:hypothetical protein